MLAVVMWAGGIAVSVTGIAYTAISGQMTRAQAIDLNQEGRISTVEAEVKRLPIIESKIDSLLRERGINPASLYEAKK